MMPRGNAATFGVAVLAVLLLGGCGQADVVATGNGATVAPGTKTAAGTGAAGCPEPTSAVPITADSDPTAVLGCTISTEQIPGRGEWSVTVSARATGRAMRDLTTALRLPSEPPSTGMCDLVAQLPTVVRLETASGPVDVAPPKGSCGQTRSEVTRAYQALSWVEVSRVRGEQLRPEAAVTAGCDRWKDMLAVSAAGARDRTARGPGPTLAPAATVKVCLYRSAYPSGWTPSSHEVVDGLPEGGGQLPATKVDRVAALLRAAGPAIPCRSEHQHFAVVSTQPQPLYVELDGCYRILAPDGSMLQGNAELADLLQAAR